MMSCDLRMLCNSPETPTQWKSESNGPTNQLTGVGSRDDYASQNIFVGENVFINHIQILITGTCH